MTSNEILCHESRNRISDGKKTLQVMVYLTVYIINRLFGGREEGGWWYDVYEAVGASFPFIGEQDYVWISSRQQEGVLAQLLADRSDGEWEVDGAPRIVDEPTRVRVESVWHHFVAMYGEPGTDHRFSCAQRQDDYAFIFELNPGERANQPRPRYA